MNFSNSCSAADYYVVRSYMVTIDWHGNWVNHKGPHVKDKVEQHVDLRNMSSPVTYVVILRLFKLLARAFR